MSRRPADKAEQNRATLKQLVKLESNKSCADCKRNKHPRWASWNIGVFVCIRCSGIHRGMGTHVSRVKSVDLDSWTDEQLQSMIQWGNARANRYWEHKLAEGHVPNEAKIENFIRTKYDSKRWVMDGPIPDPSTLSDAVDGEDDDVPLKIVQERARSSSGAGAANRTGGIPPPVAAPPAQQARARPQEVDLFGDSSDATSQQMRPSTVQPIVSNRPAAAKAAAAPPKQTRPGESLLGLDFFGNPPPTQSARPASTGPSGGGLPARTDLKQSILSLYASKPAPAPQAPVASNMAAFGGMQSPPLQSPSQIQPNSQALGGLGDAFSSLSFESTPAAQPKSAPFSNFSAPTGHSRQASSISKPALGGGGFFDAKPTPVPTSVSPPVVQASTSMAGNSFGGDWGDFSSAVPTPSITTKNSAAPSTTSNAFFGMSSPTLTPATQNKPQPTPVPAATSPPPISATNFSAFNLSQPTSKPAVPVQSPPVANLSGLNNMDAWGSSDAWATSDPSPAPIPAAAVSQPKPAPTPARPNANAFTPAPAPSISAFDNGWGEPAPPKPTPVASATVSNGFSSNATTSAGGFSVQQDEEFGGWSHASPVSTNPPTTKQGGGTFGTTSDDLFGNVWE